MNSHNDILNWAKEYLDTQGYSLNSPPKIILETPWSTILRLCTSTADFYLKQTPPSLFMEASVTQLFTKLLHNVPTVIAENDSLHCFLMADAGLNLRKYLKTHFEPELMVKAILQFTHMQRSTEHDVDAFIALGVPDWRLHNLSKLYEKMIADTAFLQTEGINDVEIQGFQELAPKIQADCDLLADYAIPETIVQYDFNTNNMLYEPRTQKMTSIDLGEIVIAHPFLSLQNFLFQAIKHENIKENSKFYKLLTETCYENWLALTTKNILADVFCLIKKLWPLYSALAFYRLMHCVDPNAFKAFYAHEPNRFAKYLREYRDS